MFFINAISQWKFQQYWIISQKDIMTNSFLILAIIIIIINNYLST